MKAIKEATYNSEDPLTRAHSSSVNDGACSPNSDLSESGNLPRSITSSQLCRHKEGHCQRVAWMQM